MTTSDKNLEKQLAEHDKADEKKPISMHENVPVWYDCCSCEAEPYWLEAMAAEPTDKKTS